MNCVQALAVAAAAFVAAGQPGAPRMAAMLAQTTALTQQIMAETSALSMACADTIAGRRDRAVPRKLPDGYIHLASRSARL